MIFLSCDPPLTVRGCIFDALRRREGTSADPRLAPGPSSPSSLPSKDLPASRIHPTSCQGLALPVGLPRPRVKVGSRWSSGSGDLGEHPDPSHTRILRLILVYSMVWFARIG